MTTSPEVSIEPRRLGLGWLDPQVGAYLVLAQSPHREGNRVPNGGAQRGRELLELPVGGDIDPDTSAMHAIMLALLHAHASGKATLPRCLCRRLGGLGGSLKPHGR